ncbi:MAG: FecR domain-containing protein [Sphingobacteriales bacterium]|nr:FecR domain-containing protein [Sphingobacteriales bacterium]
MMDPKSPYNDLPWDLIVSALQGVLSAEEETQFQQWLALSSDNRSTYERLQRMWGEEMADYQFYQQADEGGAWKELRSRMGELALPEGAGVLPEEEVETRLGAISGRAAQGKGRILAMKWAAVAAALLLLAGAEWWYVSRKGEQYMTAANETKRIPLPDGSMVVLNEHTQLRVESDYNKTDRKLVLVSGEARFDVVHNPERPFVVDMGDVSVKDIGTGFTIDRTADSIKVIVSEGRIAFVRHETGETHEIGAGQAVSFYAAEHKFGSVSNRDDLLRFDDKPLSDVIAALERTSGKKIVLSDTTMGQKKLTVHLGGESFEDAIKTICASLNLEYSVVNGEYVLTQAGAHN